MKKNQTGQSLVEVIFALAIAMLVIVALVRLTTISLKNATFAKNQALATGYAQEAIEEIRAYRDRSNWPTFVDNCESVVDLASLPAPFFFEPAPDCYLPGTANACVVTNNLCEIQVTVSWSEAGRTHQTELVTRLSNWQ